MSIKLTTSIGEAIDKLSILDIKLSKINDTRKEDVEKEFNYLKSELLEILINYNYFYKILVKINKEIWELQDYIRSDLKNDKMYYTVCDKILNLNDSRYLVKKKINQMCNSTFKEQKGYKLRILNMVILTNQENINILNGAIRYFSFFYDEIYLYVSDENLNYTKNIFKNDPFIKINTNNNPLNEEYDFIRINNENIEKKLTHSFFINNTAKNIYQDNITSKLYNSLDLDISICDEYKN